MNSNPTPFDPSMTRCSVVLSTYGAKTLRAVSIVRRVPVHATIVTVHVQVVHAAAGTSMHLL